MTLAMSPRLSAASRRYRLALGALSTARREVADALAEVQAAVAEQVQDPAAHNEHDPAMCFCVDCLSRRNTPKPERR